MSDLKPMEVCPLCSSDIIQQWDTDKETGKSFFLFHCLNRECSHTWMPTSEEHKLDIAAMLKYRKQVDTLTAEVERLKKLGCENVQLIIDHRDELKSENAQLRELLSECANKFEQAIMYIQSGESYQANKAYIEKLRAKLKPAEGDE